MSKFNNSTKPPSQHFRVITDNDHPMRSRAYGIFATSCLLAIFEGVKIANTDTILLAMSLIGLYHCSSSTKQGKKYVPPHKYDFKITGNTLTICGLNTDGKKRGQIQLDLRHTEITKRIPLGDQFNRYLPGQKLTAFSSHVAISINTHEEIRIQGLRPDTAKELERVLQEHCDLAKQNTDLEFFPPSPQNI